MMKTGRRIMIKPRQQDRGWNEGERSKRLFLLMTEKGNVVSNLDTGYNGV